MHKHFSARVVAAVAVFVVGLLGITFVKADNVLTWTIADKLYLAKVTDLSVDQIPPTFFASGNIDCSFANDNNKCSIDTNYGSIYNSSEWVDGRWIPIKDYAGNQSNFLAIPGSDTALTISSAPVEGVYLFFNSNSPISLSPQYVLRPGATDVHVIDNLLLDSFKIGFPPDRSLADRSGYKLPADLNSIAFSANSGWMVVTDPDIATMRVNINTGAVIPFGTGFTYGLGQNPQPKTAITSDGRYAVVSSLDSSVFKIYDLPSCGGVPDQITGPVDCESRDLMNTGFLQKQIPGFSGVNYIRFLDDETINLYVSYKDGPLTRYGQYLLSVTPEPRIHVDYLALGDSYISGEGVFHYLPGTDTANNQCHVSLESYPLLLGKDLNYDSYHSVACSGATTNDIVNTSTDYIGQARPKIKRKDFENDYIKLILTNFQQGYIDQLDFVKQYQPKVITVSVAGNNIGFSARLQSCLNKGTCYSTYEDRLEFVNEVNNTIPTLVDTYKKIKNSGAADTRIYAIAYPQIAEVGGNCGDNVHMNNDELVFAQQAITYLNAAIKVAASKAGVFYVDTEDAFYGHRLCEAEPGSLAMNGISAGNDFPDKLDGPIGRESYHPNAYGHQLLEAKILSATHRFTAPMPTPTTDATISSDASHDILDAPHSNRAVNNAVYDNSLSDNLIYQNQSSSFSIGNSNYILPAGAQLDSELHSDVLLLGTYTTDSAGNLSGQITIPSSVPVGYHTLHFYGRDIAGQPIDIFKVIYVGRTFDDKDGNGIVDAEQKCVGIDASGNDFDKDNIDDSCDTEITSPQTNPPESIVSGTITAYGNSLELISNSSKVKSDAPSPPDINFSSQPTQPAVLSSNVQKETNPSAPQTENIRVPISDFWQVGLTIFLAATLVYSVKLFIA